MLKDLPPYISIIFGLTTVATLLLFYWILKNSTVESVKRNALKITIGLTIWLLIQTLLTYNKVYNSNTNLFPPKIFLLGVLPVLLVITILFATQKGRQFIDSLPLANITWLNIVRVPVELVLFWLFLNRAVPELMTFKGRNFDIIAGITAPAIAYFGFATAKLNRRVILTWNFICLALLLNIVFNAFLSAPSPLQKFAFDQPNIAILNFPFSWLPTFVVPIVLFGHLVSIRRLIKEKAANKNGLT